MYAITRAVLAFELLPEHSHIGLDAPSSFPWLYIINMKT